MSFSGDFQVWLKKRADAGNQDSQVTLDFFAEKAPVLDEAWAQVMDEGGRDLIEAGKTLIREMGSERSSEHGKQNT